MKWPRSRGQSDGAGPIVGAKWETDPVLAVWESNLYGGGGVPGCGELGSIVAIETGRRGVRDVERSAEGRCLSPSTVCRSDMWWPSADVPIGHGQLHRAWSGGARASATRVPVPMC